MVGYIAIAAFVAFVAIIFITEGSEESTLNDKLHERHPESQPGDIRYCEELDVYVTLDAHNNWIAPNKVSQIKT